MVLRLDLLHQLVAMWRAQRLDGGHSAKASAIRVDGNDSISELVRAAASEEIAEKTSLVLVRKILSNAARSDAAGDPKYRTLKRKNKTIGLLLDSWSALLCVHLTAPY
eukprot:SAG31_NODE_676_length_12896_cov_10.122060_9_plen_108_part_00